MYMLDVHSGVSVTDNCQWSNGDNPGELMYFFSFPSYLPPHCSVFCVLRHNTSRGGSLQNLYEYLKKNNFRISAQVQWSKYRKIKLELNLECPETVYEWVSNPR